MSDDPGGLLIAQHRAAGAVFGSEDDAGPPRHYGDPAGEYGAATSAVAVIDRSARRRLRVAGRAPSQMLQGVITASVPAKPTRSDAVGLGRGAYSAVLTPKGRMITDLRVFSVSHADDRLLLDIPPSGMAPLSAHLASYLPPRMARVEDVSAASGMVTVMGPRAREALLDADELPAPGADHASVMKALGGLGDLAYLCSASADGWLLVVGTGPDGATALDVLGDGATVRGWWERLTAAGVRPVGQGVFETLRVEAGQPAFGADMDENTLPPEAGIEDRAIDHQKGCYTGQEVVVRIRDRGHVNRHLRGLLFGDVPTPAAGTPLFQPGGDRPIGHVTSAVSSPRFGQAIGLGYVRREVQPPAEVLLAASDGPPVGVRSLDESWGAGT